MGIFTDQSKRPQLRPGFVVMMTDEREDLIEWDTKTSESTVIEYIASRVLTIMNAPDRESSSSVPLA